MIERTIQNLASSEELESELLTKLLVDDAESPARLVPLVSASDFRKYGRHYEAWYRAKLEGKNVQATFAEAGIMQSDCVRREYLSSARRPTDIAREIRRAAKAQKVSLKLSDVAREVNYENVDGKLSELQQGIFELQRDREGREARIGPIMDEYARRQEEYRALPPGSLIGIPMGFPDLDRCIDGLRKGHFVIVAGYTNLGKSSFSLNVVANLLKLGKRVAFYSLEMSEVDIVSRLLGIMSRQNGRDILKGRGNGSESGAAELLRSSDLRIFTDKRRLDEIVFSMRESHMERPVDAFFIDYLQQIEVEGAESEYETMRDAATALQAAAQELQAPLVAVSQVSNEAARQPNSAVMGFKGAGTIASAADFAMEIVSGEESVSAQREKAMRGELTRVKVIVKKNRHGATGYAEYDFDGRTGVFQDPVESISQDWHGPPRGGAGGED